MKRLILIALTCMLCAAASTIARAQEINPQLKITKMPSLLLPDLVVSSVIVRKNLSGKLVSVRITVKNTCEVAAARSYVLATIMDKAGGKALFYIGNTVRALKGGESHEQLFSLSGNNLPAGSHVSVEVDPYKEVTEDVEGNNYRKVNPNGAPFPDGPNHCKPKS